MIQSILQDQTPQFRSYLGRYLKHKRQDRKLTMREVADRIGASEASYRSLESGRANISFETLKALFSIFDLDLNDLFELNTISKIACANDIAKELSENYPR